ncbi:unnamed protein product [Effrenium voratum]|uniref:Uncharacterized protein n=1 Tax=Effrenium voratum TaxID=2562239 RepID=A0AA36J235_9DINO|nr:unnamed protein product [Effrenium voratum]
MAVLREKLGASARASLKRRGIVSVFASHEVHVLEPLRHAHFEAEYFLCAEKLGSLPPAVTQAWAFEAKNQLRRMKQCLKLILAREAERRYDFFVRLRPDLLVLSAPDLRSVWGSSDAEGAGRRCVHARLRAARGISGLTSSHLSYCYCGGSCCARGVLPDAAKDSSADAAFVADDQLALGAREPFLRLWLGKGNSSGVPWRMAPMAETSLTEGLLRKRVPLCVLQMRALPLGSSNLGHAAEAKKCGYAELAPALNQSCGASSSVDEVPELKFDAPQNRDTTPSAAAAAARINRLLKKRKLEQVFVASDAQEGFRVELRSLVKEALYFFSPDDGADKLDEGPRQLAELLLLGEAEYFVGSTGSAFSGAVRRQRKHLGLQSKVSEEVFCPQLTAGDAARRCVSEP